MDKMIKVFNSEIRGIDEKEMTITAFISTNTRDRMDEVLEPAGVDLKNYNRNPVVLWAHQYDLPPIGKALWTKKDGENGIVSKVKFAPTPFAQEIFQLYKEGYLKAFSVGFIPKEFEDGDGEKKPRRTYKKWEMLEYSAVPVPANPEALALAIQNGVLKNETVIKSMEQFNEPIKKEEVKEAAEQEGGDIEKENLTEAHSPALDELIAYNDELVKKIMELETTVKQLRYDLYRLSAAKEKKAAEPEITADSLANTIVKTVDGVIRKAQGKLD